MGRKKNNPQESEQKVEKKSKKVTNNACDIKDEESVFEITATLIDCSRCETIHEYVEKLETECKVAKEYIEKQEQLIKTQDEVIDKLRRYNERLKTVLEFFVKCLDWAEDHLWFFTRRKYEKLFSDNALLEFISSRAEKNIADKHTVEVDEDEKMISELKEFGHILYR